MPRSETVPTDPAAYRHWTDEHVRFADLDPLGHANNNAFGVYFESGRVAFHDALGERALAGHLTVAARIAIDFRAELHRPAHLRIGTGVLRVGTTSWTLGSALFTGGHCAATSECVIVMVDRDSRRPVPIPDGLRTALSDHLLPS